MPSPYQKAYFLLSAADIKQLPEDQGVEVAIVGRSNAGKSSVLNRITHNKKLARVSKTPGRTQLINMFILDATHRITDLPGYGYAKVPLAMKQKWEKNINNYLEKRKSLVGLLIVMDIRHPLKPVDLQLLDYCNHYGLQVHILLNKADKLSKSNVAKTLKLVKSALSPYSNSITVQRFSATSGEGLEELINRLDQWYGYSNSA